MKRSQYKALCLERKNCRKCPWLSNPAEVDGGKYDADEIGPWTLWQGNLDAKVFLCGQDWGDVATFVRHAGVDPPKSYTNNRLCALFGELGIELGQPNKCDHRSQPAFFTNAILCLRREGGLQDSLPPASFRNCEGFLRRTIELVAPRLVVALGQAAHRSTLRAFGLRMPDRHKDAVEMLEPTPLPGLDTQIFAVYHCSLQTSNRRTRDLQQQLRDWSRMRPYLGDIV